MDYVPRMTDGLSPERLKRQQHLHALPVGWEQLEYATFLERRRTLIARVVREGFATRLVPAAEQSTPKAAEPLPQVTWLNHVSPEANSIQIEVEKRVRQGPPPDPRLLSTWREIYEDLVWSLINDREFVWKP